MGFLRSEKKAKQVAHKVQRTIFEFSSIGWCVRAAVIVDVILYLVSYDHTLLFATRRKTVAGQKK